MEVPTRWKRTSQGGEMPCRTVVNLRICASYSVGQFKISKGPMRVKKRPRTRHSTLTRRMARAYLRRMDPLKARVRHGYSRAWVVRKYSLIGLWPSEMHLVRAYFPPGSRLLDIGCGAGRTSVPLAQAGHDVVAIDLATPMVAQTHAIADFASNHVNGVVADAATLPFPENTFDGALFSYNGIELVPREAGKRAVLSEVFRTLRSGGHFIFTTHAFEAFNQFAWSRVERAVTQVGRTLTFRSDPHAEFGEIIPDPEHNVEVYYMQINSPRKYRRMLRSTGFGLRYFNSRSRIDAAKRPSWIADFDADFKCYVARKP